MDKNKTDDGLDLDKIDPVAQFIIQYLERVKDNEPVSNEKLAKEFWQLRKRQNDDQNEWRKYLNTTKQQAIFLARNGLIEITRRGEVVDPNDFKGLVRLRIKK